ncbi:MAG: SGNH/GDSL hydrolase family protein, partial [Clostridiales bacterium]|nr:SGNH/GDSL hydrolase family protein [Clostridiales bacterium]
IKAPIEYPHWYDEWDEAVSNWAAANNVRYFNMLKADTGLDMQTDTYDAGLHLNVKGAEKTADLLGRYLTENCTLTDFRKDPEVDRIWQENGKFYNDLMDKQLREIEEYGELISFGKNAIE